MAKKMSL